jgi:nicotinate-nucleotide adenylyltransferase
VDVSSTEVRARVAAGRSIRGFVPESVADVIESAGLYR